MMIDGKGSVLIWLLVTAIFLVIGIILNWLTWIPLYGVFICAAIPTAIIIALFVYIFFGYDWSR